MVGSLCNLRGFDLKKNLTEINHKVGLLAKWVFRLFSDLKAWRTEQCHPEGPGGVQSRRCQQVVGATSTGSAASLLSETRIETS
jgi:hypothetical protein